jgi:hypothetical protein
MRSPLRVRLCRKKASEHQSDTYGQQPNRTAADHGATSEDVRIRCAKCAAAESSGGQAPVISGSVAARGLGLVGRVHIGELPGPYTVELQCGGALRLGKVTHSRRDHAERPGR